MHTSPLRQPGVGDAGGMNVYIDELSRTMAGRGIAVDVFTRRHDPDLPLAVEVVPGYRVTHVGAGPPTDLPVRRLARYTRSFGEQVTTEMAGRGHQLVHSHYWLSGWAGLLVKRELGIPMANSFHTLGRVKDVARRHDEPPEGLLRIAAEHEVIDGSDCVIASTPFEAEDLMEHYGADPGRLCTSTPGINHRLFRPGDRQVARRRLGVTWKQVVLFVGRIQALKGVDIALEAFSLLDTPDAGMLIVGGASGSGGSQESEALRRRASEPDLDGRVRFVDPVPHRSLVDYYRAADVVILPSRTESFGLVAVEAQACGVPVVAAAVGGLSYAVEDGVSGYLVEGWAPEAYAAYLGKILRDPMVALDLANGARRNASKFSWSATTNRFIELYRGITGQS